MSSEPGQSSGWNIPESQPVNLTGPTGDCLNVYRRERVKPALPLTHIGPDSKPSLHVFLPFDRVLVECGESPQQPRDQPVEECAHLSDSTGVFRLKQACDSTSGTSCVCIK